ncbi:Uncharacterised protein [Yersinia frederiksenii]|uniref:Uncharacterized protein n=1 Tax=Yersinia frederiksenii TaxID=29484 RepID=A0A380PUL5_YERFR|nr:hypothetical protein [Yersinia frederiksenii]SUP77304.1 Uncharacterised protein [Yersinia frederiksenii]
MLTILLICIYILVSLGIFHTLTLLWASSGEVVSNAEIVLLALAGFFWPLEVIALLVSLIFAGPLLSLFRFVRRFNNKAIS